MPPVLPLSAVPFTVFHISSHILPSSSFLLFTYSHFPFLPLPLLLPLRFLSFTAFVSKNITIQTISHQRRQIDAHAHEKEQRSTYLQRQPRAVPKESFKPNQALYPYNKRQERHFKLLSALAAVFSR